MAVLTESLQVRQFFVEDASISEMMDLCYLKLATAFTSVVAPLNDLLSPHEPFLALQVGEVSFICSVVPVRAHITPTQELLLASLLTPLLYGGFTLRTQSNQPRPIEGPDRCPTRGIEFFPAEITDRPDPDILVDFIDRLCACEGD